MTLSSNSIVHLTKRKESLIGILKNNFRIKYCSEKIITRVGILEYKIPMVSFCDIPLSEIKDHVSKYGRYGIGLTKSWASKNGLNPVLYIDSESNIGQMYHILFNSQVKGKSIKKANENDKGILEVLRYMKNYQADLETDNFKIENYRFADEKEWRYVPSFDNTFGLIQSKYFEGTIKKECESKVQHLRLGFDPDDIKYIIIDDEKEISEFIDYLRKSKGEKYSYSQVERLMTRIITTKQIENDF